MALQSWHTAMIGGNGTFTREQAVAIARREREKNKGNKTISMQYAVKKGSQGYYIMMRDAT